MEATVVYLRASKTPRSWEASVERRTWTPLTEGSAAEAIDQARAVFRGSLVALTGRV